MAIFTAVLVRVQSRAPNLDLIYFKTNSASCNVSHSASEFHRICSDCCSHFKSVSFGSDLRILIGTGFKVFEQDGITEEGNATAEDLGDYLLRTQQISHEVYRVKMREAEELLKETVNC